MKVLKIIIPLGLIVGGYFIIVESDNAWVEFAAALFLMIIPTWYLLKLGWETFFKSRKK